MKVFSVLFLTLTVLLIGITSCSPAVNPDGSSSGILGIGSSSANLGGGTSLKVELKATADLKLKLKSLPVMTKAGLMTNASLSFTPTSLKLLLRGYRLSGTNSAGVSKIIGISYPSPTWVELINDDPTATISSLIEPITEYNYGFYDRVMIDIGVELSSVSNYQLSGRLTNVDGEDYTFSNCYLSYGVATKGLKLSKPVVVNADNSNSLKLVFDFNGCGKIVAQNTAQPTPVPGLPDNFSIWAEIPIIGYFGYQDPVITRYLVRFNDTMPVFWGSTNDWYYKVVVARDPDGSPVYAFWSRINENQTTYAGPPMSSDVFSDVRGPVFVSNAGGWEMEFPHDPDQDLYSMKFIGFDFNAAITRASFHTPATCITIPVPILIFEKTVRRVYV